MKTFGAERNRTDPWAFGWPALKIGLRLLLWPTLGNVIVYSQPDVRIAGEAKSERLALVPEETIQKLTQPQIRPK